MKRNALPYILVLLIGVVGIVVVVSKDYSFRTGGSSVIWKAVSAPQEVYGTNLVNNPSFEKEEGWYVYGEGYQRDAEVTHEGAVSMKIIPKNLNKLYGAFQAIQLDFDQEETNKDIMIGAWGRYESEVNEGIVGKLYADVYALDGSEVQYGLVVPFEAEKSGQWYHREKQFTIKKPSTIVLYVQRGDVIDVPVYFDDIFIGEVGERYEEGQGSFDRYPVSSHKAHATSEMRTPKPVATLTTKDDFSLVMSNEGTLTKVVVDGQDISEPTSRQSSGFFIKDVANDSDFIRPKGGVQKRGDVLYQKGPVEPLDLQFEGVYQAGEQFIEVKGTIVNRTQEDRALTVYFGIPVSAEGWQWWKSPRAVSAIKLGNEYILGDQVGSAGKSSPYPISALNSEKVNLTYGVRFNQPRVVRMGYDTWAKLYYIAFDIGLSPATTKFPNQADFSFIIYKSSPEWGFRAALKRYYEFYPGFFERRAKQEGIWLPGTHFLREAASPKDFGIAFHHGLRDVDRGDTLGIYSADYLAMQLQVACRFEAREKPSLNDILESIKGSDDEQALVLSALYDASGTWQHTIEKVGWFVDKRKGNADERGWAWCGIFYTNTDPDISEGPCQGASRRFEDRVQSYKEKGMMVDGVSFDGISTEYLNFRKEHFAYADAPLSFDYVTKKPALIGAFSNYKCAQKIADDQHKGGQIVIANGIPPNYMFGTHLIDSGNQEVTGPLPDERAMHARALLYQKPFSVMWSADFSLPGIRSQLESFMKRALFYGFFPTAFTVPGGGEDMNYFEHPEWYEEGRPLFKKYIPLIREISRAGWEPVPYARSSDPEVYVERFGRNKDSLFFTVFNASKNRKTVTITIDREPLGSISGKVAVRDELSGVEISSVVYDEQRKVLKVEVIVPGNGVKLLRVI